MEREIAMRKNSYKVVAGVGLVALAPLAVASGPDYSGITSAVDFGAVATGVIAVGALIAAVLVAKRGARMLLSMIGR